MHITYDEATSFDINYNPAHLIEQQRSELQTRYKDKHNTTWQVHGLSRESFLGGKRHHKTMRAMRQSIENTKKRYIRYHLGKLRKRRDQLEQFQAERNWGLRVGDVLSTLNWSEKKRKELNEIYDLIDRLNIPNAYLFDDDQPEWLK